MATSLDLLIPNEACILRAVCGAIASAPLIFLVFSVIEPCECFRNVNMVHGLSSVNIRDLFFVPVKECKSFALAGSAVEVALASACDCMCPALCSAQKRVLLLSCQAG
eukprot:CAMPEP_0194751708 /NCGR_PEP_ID=MMETSP0323_2-20130528/5683_1 /TAXON_ID=2866 ORGANISM="Crypthecodinium cohnii, Strain Seligo" /NCGR_SAMPLE_ID=MMETSP0323_2 /ASSEMBLY_ACC=CAM_ASM_000346 /LENGTH=107 /DNA_ID=CAMNT_0039668303 /DNA_START=69 /DNA_END=389 /DNA_ORIENTATION=-